MTPVTKGPRDEDLSRVCRKYSRERCHLSALRSQGWRICRARRRSGSQEEHIVQRNRRAHCPWLRRRAALLLCACFDRPALAGGAAGARGGAALAMQEQSQTDWAGAAQLRRRMGLVATG